MIVGQGVEVSGDLTLESTGSGNLVLGANDVSGDLTLDTEGYDQISGATAGGETTIASTNTEALMRVELMEGAFETPVAFTITRLDPQTRSLKRGQVPTASRQSFTRLSHTS